MKYCIKPENSDEKLYGDSFEEIAKDNDLTKIGNHYFVKANKKEDKKYFSKTTNPKKEIAGESFQDTKGIFK